MKARRLSKQDEVWASSTIPPGLSASRQLAERTVRQVFRAAKPDGEVLWTLHEAAHWTASSPAAELEEFLVAALGDIDGHRRSFPPGHVEHLQSAIRDNLDAWPEPSPDPHLADRLSYAAERADRRRDAARDDARRAFEERVGPTRMAAARLLGMKPTEILDVVDVEGDLHVTTSDAQVLVIVDDDHPDGAGRAGIMLLYPPKYTTSIEVFTPRTSTTSDAEVPA